MKKYVYDSMRFKWKVTLTGIIAGVVLVISVYNLLINPNNYVWLAGFAVGFYSFWESFISIANPETVEISPNYIEFSAYGRTHKFNMSDIKTFKVKEFTAAKKMFIRINDPGFLKGRYWVNCRFFDEPDELFNKIRNLEYAIEPNSMKAYARKSNEEDLKKRLNKKSKAST